MTEPQFPVEFNLHDIPFCISRLADQPDDGHVLIAVHPKAVFYPGIEGGSADSQTFDPREFSEDRGGAVAIASGTEDAGLDKRDATIAKMASRVVEKRFAEHGFNATRYHPAEGVPSPAEIDDSYITYIQSPSQARVQEIIKFCTTELAEKPLVAASVPPIKLSVRASRPASTTIRPDKSEFGKDLDALSGLLGENFPHLTGNEKSWLATKLLEWEKEKMKNPNSSLVTPRDVAVNELPGRLNEQQLSTLAVTIYTWFEDRKRSKGTPPSPPARP